MKLNLTCASRAAIGAACLLALSSVQAQGTSTTTSPQADPRTNMGTRADSYSLLPYTSQGYVGLNVGQSKWKLSCSDPLRLFRCDDSDTRFDLYTGGLINEIVGAEIGYANEGKFERAGGRARAEGIKLNLVVRAPIGGFNVFAKGGTIYGRTKVSADALSGVPTGKDSGWGVSWGAGVGYDFTRNLGAVLEWSRNEYRFRGTGRDDVDSTNLGLVYRF